MMVVIKFNYYNKIKKVIYNDQYNYELIRTLVNKFYNLNNNYIWLIRDKRNYFRLDNIMVIKNYINNYFKNKRKILIEIIIKEIQELNPINNSNSNSNISNSNSTISKKVESINSFISLTNKNFIISNKNYNEILNDSILKRGSKKDFRFRNIIHLEIKCDRCNKYGIRGIRYKCSFCKNFNLCEDCEKKKKKFHNKYHIFIRIVENYRDYNFENVNYYNNCNKNLLKKNKSNTEFTLNSINNKIYKNKSELNINTVKRNNINLSWTNNFKNNKIKKKILKRKLNKEDEKGIKHKIDKKVNGIVKKIYKFGKNIAYKLGSKSKKITVLNNNEIIKKEKINDKFFNKKNYTSIIMDDKIKKNYN